MSFGVRQESPEVTSSNITTAPKLTPINLTSQHREKFSFISVPHKVAEVSHKSDEIPNADEDGSNIRPTSELYSPLPSDADVKPSDYIFPNDNKQTDISQTTDSKQCKSIHKSVIVVSSHKPNVTTIDVERLGAPSDQYSMAPRTLVSVSDAMTSEALSLSQTANNIITSQISTLPLTRVTKVIPISSENRSEDDMFHCRPLHVSENLTPENSERSIASTVSYVSRPTETVISPSVAGCGTPSDALKVPNKTCQKDTANTSSKRISNAQSSNEDAASKFEVTDFGTFANSNQQSSSLGSSLSVAHYHSDSVKSDSVTGSSALQESTPNHSGDLAKTSFLVASPKLQTFPENSAMQDKSGSAMYTPNSQLNNDIVSDSSKQNTRQVVPLHVGMTSSYIENEGIGRDTHLQTTPSSHSSDSVVAQTFTTKDLSKVPETTEKNISKSEICETSSVSNSGSSTSTFPAIVEGVSVAAVDKDTSVTAADQPNEKLSAETEVQLPKTSLELDIDPDIRSVKGDSTTQCRERPEKRKLGESSEDALTKRTETADHQRGVICSGVISADSGFASTEEDRVMPTSLHQSQSVDKSSEALTVKCYSHEEGIKSINTSQPESLELLSQDTEEVLDEEFQTEGEGTSQEDGISIEMKHRSHGQKSPESETAELSEDHEEIHGDDHMPVTRKRSMRASGRGRHSMKGMILHLLSSSNNTFMCV